MIAAPELASTCPLPSVCCAVMVCTALERPNFVKLHPPSESVLAEPSALFPSKSLIVLFGSAVPFNVTPTQWFTIFVNARLSPLDDSVTLTLAALDAALVFPAASTATDVKL